MNMQTIYTIGETVFDILFKGNQPVAARPGGSMLNASVSLGRLGLPVHFVSEIGNDQVGLQILKFLKESNVGINKGAVFNDGNTALALAHLDDDENASYTFYKNYPKKRLAIPFPDFQANDMVLFGSFFSISEAVRSQLIDFLEKARAAGALIIYDPNFRESHLPDLIRHKPYILENINFADIIRGSHEDFKLVFNTHSPDDAYDEIPEKNKKVLIYTAGSNFVSFRSSRLNFSMQVPEIDAVSTIGAGDSFNAGIIYGIYRLGIKREDLVGLKQAEWQAILDSGITLGSMVCESYDNYIPEAFARKLRNLHA
jgi:fructokinase